MKTIVPGQQYKIQTSRLFEYLDAAENSCFVVITPGTVVNAAAVISTSDSLYGQFESVLCEVQLEHLDDVAQALVAAVHLK